MRKAVDGLWAHIGHACGQLASFYTDRFAGMPVLGTSLRLFPISRTAFAKLFPTTKPHLTTGTQFFSPLSTPITTMSTNLSKYINNKEL